MKKAKTAPLWSASAISKMHLHRISITELAKHLHCRREYISRLFNGIEIASDKKVAEIETAISEIIAERK